MPDCDRCGYFCKTAKCLINHQKTSKYCAKYQDIIFVCRRCNFNTKGLKKIENHSAECTGENIIANPLTEMVNAKQLIQDEKRLLAIKVTQLETKLRNKDLSIMNLQLRIQFEQMKNKIYTNIIQTQTDIKLEDIIEEKTDEVHIFNFENGKIPVVVHDFADERTEKYILEPPKPKKKIKRIKRIKVDDSPSFVIENDEPKSTKSATPEKQKKKIYRTVKEYTKTSEKVLQSKLKKDIVRVDKEIDQIVYDNYDVSHKGITEQLETLFTTVTNNRVYTTSLASIRRLRSKLLGKLSLSEYTALVLEHIERLTVIFTTKNYNTKKVQKIISSKSLTPLDARLAYYEGYTNVNIGPDEVQQFGLALGILIEHEKQFVPYDKNIFIQNIKNYGLSLFEIRDCIERCLVNRYGFHNVIYIPRLKSTSKDPFSFYTLTSVGNVRNWNMVCRLEDFVIYFADIALSYCISLFRKIYKDVFNDNIYRDDYMGKSQITEYDCEQLILNIISLAQPMTICKIFQEIIMTKCTITPTESDKFDYITDDKMQKKRFAYTKDRDEDTCQVMKRIFDGISDEDSMNIINSR